MKSKHIIWLSLLATWSLFIAIFSNEKLIISINIIVFLSCIVLTAAIANKAKYEEYMTEQPVYESKEEIKKEDVSYI